MKIMTILGTRPEIIRLSRIIPKLDKVCNHVLLYTNQSFDFNLGEVFFEGFGIRKPDYVLDTLGQTFGERLGKILWKTEGVIEGMWRPGNKVKKPDKILILGDTNSALSVIMAKRMCIPVYHMEAGNRCFDDRVPEEINRRIIDHSSDIHMPYTERSRMNLLKEGIPNNRIYVTGNPIFEVLLNHKDNFSVLKDLRLKSGQYILATAHREENVDIPSRLKSLLGACVKLAKHYPVIFSRHPRTEKMMVVNGFDYPSICFHEPFNFTEFLALLKNAACVVTDSGTVQEECCILRVRCVTVRDTTERQETVECGSNIISGLRTESILRCVKTAMAKGTDWEIPQEYLVRNVSDTVVNILMGVNPWENMNGQRSRADGVG